MSMEMERVKSKGMWSNYKVKHKILRGGDVNLETSLKSITNYKQDGHVNSSERTENECLNSLWNIVWNTKYI